MLDKVYIFGSVFSCETREDEHACSLCGISEDGGHADGDDDDGDLARFEGFWLGDRRIANYYADTCLWDIAHIFEENVKDREISSTADKFISDEDLDEVEYDEPPGIVIDPGSCGFQSLSCSKSKRDVYVHSAVGIRGKILLLKDGKVLEIFDTQTKRYINDSCCFNSKLCLVDFTNQRYLQTDC